MKRYDWGHAADGPYSVAHDEGRWVLHDEAAARIAALKEQVQMYADSFARTMLERDAARTELAQLREGIALRAKGQVGPDALVEELRTELAAARTERESLREYGMKRDSELADSQRELAEARVNEARVATQVLKVRDRMIEQNYSEAWHQLYQIASPDFTSYTPWRELERLTNYSGAYSMDSQLAAEKGAIMELKATRERAALDAIRQLHAYWLGSRPRNSVKDQTAACLFELLQRREHELCNCRAHPIDGYWLDINCELHGNRFKQERGLTK